MDLSTADALALLRLQVEWGAEDALDIAPHDRMAVAVAAEPERPAPPPLVAPLRPAGSQAPTGRSAGSHQAEALAAGAMSVPALRAALARFDGCALRHTAGHTVFAEGDPAAGILLVGEVPDADEDRAGTPFAGASGALLDQMLASISLSRTGMMIAPLIPWRPPGDRKVSAIEMAACLPFLYRLVALAQPKHLIVMGVRPTRAIFGPDAALARIRGRFYSVTVPGMKTATATLPMRHTSHLLGNPPSRRDAWLDLLLLRQTLDG